SKGTSTAPFNRIMSGGERAWLSLPGSWLSSIEAPAQVLGDFGILILSALLPRLQDLLFAARAGDPERLQIPAGDAALLAEPLLLGEVLGSDVRDRRERLDLVGERDQDLEGRRGRLVGHREAELPLHERVGVGELLAGDL